MKNKNYRFGTTTFKAYMKTAGEGFEVGLKFGNKQLFCGNFIHAKEAHGWWSLMNREIRSFTKRYWVGKNCSITWYSKFLGHHLYNKYYGFIERHIRTYNRSFKSAYFQDLRKYKRLRKNWKPSEQIKIKAA